MRTVELNLIKKNRVYFKCLNERDYEVKLKISPKSENLALGKHLLLVRDCSVRTKYGTDIIYDMEAEVTHDKIVTLTSDYNTNLVSRCRTLGGKWEAETKCWVFSNIVSDEVEQLNELYNSIKVTVEITAKEDLFALTDPIIFLGYPVCVAKCRDSGANLCDNVALIAGRISSGGSSKNWGTCASAGSIFRMQVASKVLKNFLSNSASTEKFDVKELS